ncbi:YybH family protein [Pseudomonas aeruginosa]|uniref:YybH family protein n=1 Tax=Pseudomonas aeruginosa TaxID=287 RepID=UPI003D2683C0
MKQTVATDPDEANVVRHEVIEHYGSLLASGDLEGILKLYHPDAEIVPQGLPTVSGINEIRKFYQETFKSIKIHGSLQVTSLFHSGDVCCVRCEEPARIEELKTGKLVNSYFRELFVVKKCCDGWKIQYYFFSENPSQATKL